MKKGLKKGSRPETELQDPDLNTDFQDPDPNTELKDPDQTRKFRIQTGNRNFQDPDRKQNFSESIVATKLRPATYPIHNVCNQRLTRY